MRRTLNTVAGVLVVGTLGSAALFSTHAGAASAAPLVSAAPPRVTVSADVLTPSRPLPQSFLGVSMEYWDVQKYAAPSNMNQLQRILGALNTDGKNPVSIRIGGGSSSNVAWGPTGQANPAGVTYDLTSAWASTVRALLVGLGSRGIFALNMGADDPALAAREAAGIASAVGPTRIAAFEIANEPDDFSDETLYGSVPTRPADYSVQDYLGELGSFTRALAGKTGGVALAGPSFASFKWLSPTTLAGVDAAMAPGKSLMTWQRYPLISCGLRPGQPGYPTLQALLAPQTEAWLISNFKTIVANANKEKDQLRVTELNSVGCGGAVGVSNTLGSSLWLVPTLFDLANLGVSGVNVHATTPANYSPFSITSKGLALNPIYYGMLFFARATQGTNVSMLQTAMVPTAGVHSYALMDSSEQLRFVMVNTNASALPVLVKSDRLTAARMHVLTGASLSATSGETLDGVAYDPSRSLMPSQGAIVRPAQGGYNITVPPNSAVLLTIPKG